MGPGTTATRSVWHFGCDMGYSQMHYNQACNVSPEQKALLDELIDLHFLVHQECIGKQLREPKCRSQTVLDQFRSVLIKLATSGVQGLADDPLVSFLPQWLELKPDLKVMMTLRDPEEWAVSRIEHKWDELTRCKDRDKKSASLLFYLDCMQGTEYVSDNLTTMKEEGDTILLSTLLEEEAVRFSIHCKAVTDLVPEENLHELCMFDYNPLITEEEARMKEELRDVYNFAMNS
eukprot:scaffold207_cov409-Prasinococcus_capsulatus_cf.AAC.73